MRLTPMVWSALYLLALPILTAMFDLGVIGATLAVFLGLAVFWWYGWRLCWHRRQDPRYSSIRFRPATMWRRPAGVSIVSAWPIRKCPTQARWVCSRRVAPCRGCASAPGRWSPRSATLRISCAICGVATAASSPGLPFSNRVRRHWRSKRELDRYGVDLQRWVYYQILPDRSLTLHLWGADDPDLPAWQRAAVRLVFPLLKMLISRSFRLSPRAHQKVLANIEACLTSMEERLSDGRQTLLGGNDSSFVDITLAALSGLWLMPSQYGGGRAEGVRAGIDDVAGRHGRGRAALEGHNFRWSRLISSDCIGKNAAFRLRDISPAG